MLARLKASRLEAIGVIVVFALAGILVLQLSRAAGGSAFIEAEAGDRSGPAAELNEAGSSGGKAVRLWSNEAGPTATPTMPPMGNQIPLDQLPKGFAGVGTPLISGGAPFGDPTPTKTSAFRVECGYTHMNYDDPIVYPGQQGRAHLHAYFGNAGANYASTYESLLTTGNSACSGGTLNRSAYWVPSMMNGDTPVAPTKSVVYYKSGWDSVHFSTIQKLPDGIKFIAGSKDATSDQNELHKHFVNFQCETSDGSSINSGPTIPSCPSGQDVVLVIDFPQCWDGVNLDSPDHKSHMSMPVDWSREGCPATHPVPIPHITMLVHWPSNGSTGSWRLSSDMYPTSEPGGYSAHADYIEAWDKEIKDQFVVGCLNAGKDCQVRWLGDGRTLINAPGVE